jgi:cystathionine beta-lyase
LDYSFDQVIDRRSSESDKWHKYDADVLPLWVADMDFAAPPAVLQALERRIRHGVFGYSMEPPELREVIVDRLDRLYGWRVLSDDLVFLPGVATGYNMATQTVTSPGDGVLVQTPVYYPILYAPDYASCTLDDMRLTREPDGRYTIDLAQMAEHVGKRTRIFILCNPHNPVGRVFSRLELAQMAELCLRHELVICSDEIHCDLMIGDNHHVPIASIAPEIARSTITLMAPSKTFNVPGLQCAFAIIQNPELRQRYLQARSGIVPSRVNVLGSVAALAAYRHSDGWLEAVLRYIEDNCDFLVRALETHMPGISMIRPEGTYLAWLDCRRSGIQGNPHQFFLEKARVALNDGATFGRGGEGFVRLNFACPRSTLESALQRMREAIDRLDEADAGRASS